MSSVLTPWLPIYPCVHAIRCPFLYIFHSEKNLNLFATNGCNKMCVCVRLLEWLHWWHNFLCYLLEKRYVVFITSWHCSLGGNFLADTIRYLSWPALSRSWHLAASGMGLRVMSHQAGLLTTLHHIHICFPEQGGNMVTTMGWGFSDFRQLFCFPLLINKACMYHNHIPLMYIFDSPAMNAGFPIPLKRGHQDSSPNNDHWGDMLLLLRYFETEAAQIYLPNPQKNASFYTHHHLWFQLLTYLTIFSDKLLVSNHCHILNYQCALIDM